MEDRHLFINEDIGEQALADWMALPWDASWNNFAARWRGVLRGEGFVC